MHLIAFSSSRGTTFQAILDRIADGTVRSRFLGLITDRRDRGCVEKATAAGVPVEVVERTPGESREQYDEKVYRAIERLMGDVPKEDVLLTALGWMFIFTPSFIHRWRNRIINVHPALLPQHGGKGMYGHHVHDAVLGAGDAQSGVTIHLMDEGVDTGRILVQKTCLVLPTDTADSLQKRVQELEKQWYPETIAMIERGELQL